MLAEIVYVLNKTYQVPKSEVSKTLAKLLRNSHILVDDKEVLNLALNLFDKKNIDFVDSILCACNKLRNENIASFDKKLNKCIDS